MKIALDAMGGDHAPEVNILGAKDALARHQGIEKIILTGPESVVREECLKHGLDASSPRVEIADAPEIVSMDEAGARALRRKKKSSIAIAAELVKAGEADALVSAGNTGAVVAAATIKLRLLKGVERAGIASALPNEHGHCLILDAGANPEAKPGHLLDYAVMGAVFARHIHGSRSPTVGIMSNGEEDDKGTTFTKETFALLKHLADHGKAPFEFLGNVEGHDLFQTRLDVCLCDGFTGNVVLKSCEATAKAFAKWMKAELKANPLRMAGAAIARGAFRAIRERTSYETVGGSPLLGVNGICVIAHGGSSALAIRNALRVAMQSVERQVNPEIEKALYDLTQP